MSRWSEDLHRRFEEFEVDAPENLFDDIMEALPAVSAEPQPARVIPLWVKRAAVAAAVVMAVAAGVMTLREGADAPAEEALLATATVVPSDKAASATMTPPPAQPITEQMATGQETAGQKIMEQTTTGQKVTGQMATAPTKAEKAERNTLAQSEPSNLVQTEPNATEKTEQTAPDTSEPAKPSQAEPSSPTQPIKAAQATTPERQRSQTQRTIYTAQSPRAESPTSGRLMANLFTSGFSGSRHGHASQQRFMVNSILFGDKISADAVVGDDDMTLESGVDEVVIYDPAQRVNTDIRHHQPIRVGVSLRYALSDRWAVESGLQYANLRSDSSSGYAANYYEDRMSLHYIGLPLSAVFTMWESRRLKIYLSAGGLVEKCVAGSLRTDYVIGGERERGERVDAMVDELQFSVNAGAGLQLNLSPTVGIYAEPGVGYWFDNGSAIETIYRTRPLNFNLNLGVRFTL